MSKDKEAQRRKDSILRGRIRILCDQGLSIEQAAEEIGIDLQEAQRLVRRRQAPRRDTLDRDLWLEFISLFLEQGEGPARFNGFPLNESQSRSLHRWRNEGASPMFFGADSFLTASELHINDFLTFCEQRGESPWASGVAPDYELAS